MVKSSSLLHKLYRDLLQRYQDFFLCQRSKFFFVHGYAQDEIHIKLLADGFQLCQAVINCIVAVFQFCYFQKTVEVHIFQIMILRENPAEKSDSSNICFELLSI